MDLYIGIKRERAEKLVKELIDALTPSSRGGQTFSVEAYAKNENGEDVTINISNDDMERPEAEDIYVEYSR